ncbi:uncharacterized protein [Leptinotarsa decemlineata]|uniref:uncharacterized protein n=1 Tax=Leptinotarsa decemlineata TaxID=7539 RepID=UPI003D30A427
MKQILILLLISATHSTHSQYSVQPINNTIGIFLHEESTLKISNDKWTLLVYKDLDSIEFALNNNNKILENMLYTFDQSNPRMLSFKTEVKTHISLLTQISDSLDLKYREIFADTQNYYKRSKRGLINGIGTFWKAITGNLDSSDGEYYTNCINKLTQDEHQLENLLKNQISVTTSVIRNFNTTIQKLQIDEETFNRDIKQIEQSIYNISDDLAYYEAQLKTLEICETLMESYLFLESTLDDILNSITFARLKILHSSIITPNDLMNSLQEISQSLHKNNLPLPTMLSHVAQYIEIIELEAYQVDKRIVFILKIPLVEPETYTLYRLLPIPIPDNRTGLHHILLTVQKYIARDDESLLYISLQNLENCKTLNHGVRICSDLLPYPIDSEAICEAQLLRRLTVLPKTCQSSLIYATEYNIQELSLNLWLITISEVLPITINCENMEPVTRVIKTNSLLKLQPGCSSFVGSTRIHSKYFVDRYKNVTYKNHAVRIPYSCCDHLPEKRHLPELKPLKLNKINVDELNIAQHKLNQYSEELDKLINEPFVNKHISWFTYCTITLIIVLIILYIFCKCRRKGPIRIGITSTSNQPPPDHPRSDRQPSRILTRFIPRRRPSINLQEPIEEEIQLNTSFHKENVL